MAVEGAVKCSSHMDYVKHAIDSERVKKHQKWFGTCRRCGNPSTIVPCPGLLGGCSECVMATVEEAFPHLKREGFCPVSECDPNCSDMGCSDCHEEGFLTDLIPHLNDSSRGGGGHGWTREQIAEWLDTFGEALRMTEKEVTQ